ncbi:MAG: sensor histidine kinase [Pseudomonadota bacterium]
MISLSKLRPLGSVLIWGLVWLVLASLALTSGVWAQADSDGSSGLVPVELPVGNNHSQPFDRMQYWLDESGSIDPNIALANRGDFADVSSPWIDFGDAEATVWLLFRVTNTSERSGDWMLDIQRPFVDDLIVIKADGRSVQEVLLAAGAYSSFADRPVVSQYLVSPLAMEAGETTDILIGMRSSTGSWMPATLATQERMRTAHMQEARFNWLINGAIAMLVLAALAMGKLIGWRSALPFALYAICGAAFVANNEGYLHRFIWPELPWLYQPANAVLIPLMALSGLVFARNFVGLDERHSVLNTALKIALPILAVLAISGLFLWPQPWFTALTYGAVPFSAALYLILGWIALRQKALGGIPFFIGTLAVAATVAFTTLVMLTPGRLPLTVALDYIHLTLLIETLAFFIAIVVRALAIQRDLNTALKTEIALTHEKLELAEQLQASRVRYDKARSQAEGMRAKLASTSHDLQQPLLSLRQGLQNLQNADPETAERIGSALDYLESVTGHGLDTSTPDDTLKGEKPDEGHEDFAVSIVTRNCAAMFANEAAEQGVTLDIQDSDLVVRTDPVSLMRAVSNLLSNALKHAEATRISLQCSAQDDQVAIRVSDDGMGLSDEQARALSQAYAKGDGSEGHGLGLYLVFQFAEAPGHSFSINSETGKGAAMTICVPSGTPANISNG